jgi:hypothetical protein
MPEYSQINFIPGVKYDLKGKTNRIVFSECEYIGEDEIGDLIFRGGKWLNEDSTPSFKWDLPPVNLTYSKELMRGFIVTEHKSSGGRIKNTKSKKNKTSKKSKKNKTSKK